MFKHVVGNRAKNACCVAKIVTKMDENEDMRGMERLPHSQCIELSTSKLSGANVKVVIFKENLCITPIK